MSNCWKMDNKADQPSNIEKNKEALKKLDVLVKSCISDKKYSLDSQKIRITQNASNKNLGKIVFYPSVPISHLLRGRTKGDHEDLAQQRYTKGPTVDVTTSRNILRKRELLQGNVKLSERIKTAKSSYPRDKQLMDFRRHINYQRMRNNLPPLQYAKPPNKKFISLAKFSSSQSVSGHLHLPRLIERPTPVRPPWTGNGPDLIQQIPTSELDFHLCQDQETQLQRNEKPQKQKSIFTQINGEIVPEEPEMEEDNEEGFLAVISYLYRERHR